MTRIQLRHDTAENWVAANPTLLDGEVGVETDTQKLKIGDGETDWNSLDYFFSESGGEGGTVEVDIATVDKAGIVKPDGTTITITEDGTISSVGGGSAEVDTSNLVTLDSEQTITGKKTFSVEGESSPNTLNIVPHINTSSDSSSNSFSIKADGGYSDFLGISCNKSGGYPSYHIQTLVDFSSDLKFVGYRGGSTVSFGTSAWQTRPQTYTTGNGANGYKPLLHFGNITAGDGVTITDNGNNGITLSVDIPEISVATTTSLGTVKPDGETISIDLDGTISATNEFDEVMAPLSVNTIQDNVNSLSSYTVDETQYYFLNSSVYALTNNTRAFMFDAYPSVYLYGIEGKHRINPNAHCLIRRNVSYGDIFNINSRYVDTEGTLYIADPDTHYGMSSMGRFIFGTIDDSNQFMPKLFIAYNLAIVTPDEPDTSTGAYLWRWENSETMQAIPSDTGVAWDTLKEFTITEVDGLAVLTATVSTEGVESQVVYNLNVALADLNINCILLDCQVSSTDDTPKMSTYGIFKADDCWIKDSTGEVVWKIGDTYVSKQLKLLYDEETLAVIDNKLAANVSSSGSTSIPNQVQTSDGSLNLQFQVMTQADYDALETKDGSTLYFVNG